MLPLTKRQREILDYLNEFIAQHGYAPSLEEIRTHLAKVDLGRPKWPESIEVIEEFPRTASGKVKKYELREGLRKRGSKG